ncbi:hypothetical protein H5T58_01730 [Candidatus Parcubacteria bacterium]|nr:hypothetical protein [Candidatus Parcubacteria bacterium]
MKSSEILEDCGWFQHALMTANSDKEALELFERLLSAHFRRSRFLLESVGRNNPHLASILPQFPASKKEIAQFKQEWEVKSQLPIFKEIRLALEKIPDETEKEKAILALLELILYLTDFCVNAEIVKEKLSEFFLRHNLPQNLLLRLNTLLNL